MPLIETKGAASAQGFGEFTQTSEAVYIESCFSTYLYTGDGSTQTITNGIDLAGKGGLVWIKSRSTANNNFLTDTVRGGSQNLRSDATNAQQNYGTLTFNANGFSAPSSNGFGNNGVTFASWTFREQPKFFDIVTYTGTGSAITLNHNLGSIPACIIVKNTTSAQQWNVYHRSLNGGTNPEQYFVVLNTTAAFAFSSNQWNSTAPTSTQFTVGSVNSSTGDSYVAYLFAHNAGGFGLTGSDNVISCGSFTTDGSGNATVNLGYEPQWILYKNTTAAQVWAMADNMRGLNVGGTTVFLSPTNSNPEQNLASQLQPTSTGFVTNGIGGATSNTYIYIAIRRGPMKTPTSGTSVFSPVTYSGGTAQSQNLGFNGDLLFIKKRSPTASDRSIFIDRLRGFVLLSATDTGAELTPGDFGLTNASFPSYTGSNKSNFSSIPTGDNGWNSSGSDYVDYGIARAPGFFDEVCYTGTGSATTQAHNLGVVPELMIVKQRSATNAWQVYSSALANTEYLVLNTTAAKATGATRWNSTTPTSTVFSIGTASEVNTSTATYVAYLFATCPGVSKVGSYTGTGTTLQVNCGFTGGSRFVLIKRTDSTGDWYVWDSARGIVAGNDPYLLLNSTAAEVTGTDYVDTYSAGFEISSTAPAAINANGGTFIFLAIA